ncbi:helix-turn-helix domain-containing protein [Paraprevotella clara]|uniref:DNA binding domain, excisionase family n=1 Tax=Paraprevotella clara YIT 11840 TaxID=762968 RepID=G5SN14_9BACT|nr:helix-turn-helix domain-containing protein [Paraprevotella clara]EHH01431.1 DNA binding domain, excisionase family [Paraprevotella clara YIT 11840]
MNENVLTAESEPLATLLQGIRKTVKKAVRLTAEYRPPLNGERYLTDKEVAERLKVSRRTLQEYRNARLLPFIVFGGKVLYKECDIERLLEGNYRKAIR